MRRTGAQYLFFTTGKYRRCMIPLLLTMLALLPAAAVLAGSCEACNREARLRHTGGVPEGLTGQAWSAIQMAIERDRYRLRPCELEGRQVYQAPNDTQNL